MKWLLALIILLMPLISEAREARPALKPIPPIPQDVQAIWWACYAAKHDLRPATSLMERIGPFLWKSGQKEDFIGLCWGA